MFIIVANWKANLTFLEARALCEDNLQAYAELGATKDVEIVICPSYEALYTVARLFKETALKIGAQNCSSHRKGAYTGQVLAESLAEIGCTYTLVGHQESRAYLKEQSDEIAQKVERLLEAGIEPIVCIGETKQEYETHTTVQALERQLDPILEKLKKNEAPAHRRLCIAYEPVWAIGTGSVPEEKQLVAIFSWLQRTCASIPAYSFRFLYGGSVTAETFCALQSIPSMKGILIGGASLDFKKFQKIVSSL